MFERPFLFVDLSTGILDMACRTGLSSRSRTRPWQSGRTNNSLAGIAPEFEVLICVQGECPPHDGELSRRINAEEVTRGPAG
jgi:hypothetical protein